MGFKCGIVGLPNVGKSTLFNALTRSEIPAENYPFCTIDPNVGTVEVPDPRMQALEALVKPQRTIPAAMQFVDIAGLVAGAAKGEGLGNQFLAHIRETQAIAHVVRCHQDAQVTHVAGRIDPLADVQTIDTELCLADLEVLERAKAKAGRLAKSGDKEARVRLEALEGMLAHLNEGQALRRLSMSAVQQELSCAYHLITVKPVLYIANVDDQADSDQEAVQALQQWAQHDNAEVVVVCAKLESEIALLEADEQQEFLQDLGWQEPGLARVIRAGYRLLGLETFFTAGPKELRAWTVAKGATAPQAAGVIHTDFIKHFIRAEVVSFDDYVARGGEAGAKEAGLWRLEGKDYVVQDGDVIYFRTSS